MAMTDAQWKEIIEDKCELMHEMLTNFTTEVKKMGGSEAFEFIKPLQDMLFHAAMEVLENRNKRIAEGEETIMKILKPNPEE